MSGCRHSYRLIDAPLLQIFHTAREGFSTTSNITNQLLIKIGLSLSSLPLEKSGLGVYTVVKRKPLNPPGSAEPPPLSNPSALARAPPLSGEAGAFPSHTGSIRAAFGSPEKG